MADQEQNFVKKLSEVNASAVSIQTLSNWWGPSPLAPLASGCLAVYAFGAVT